MSALTIALSVGLGAGRSVARAQTDPGFTTGEAVVVNTDLLNLRAAAGTNAGVLAVLIDGTEGTVTGGPVTANGFVWYRLDVDGTVGWSDAEFLRAAAGAQLPVGSLAVVTTDLLNLRAAPGSGSGVVTTLANGAVAAVIDGPVTADGHDWYQLYFDGTMGWAVRDFLAFEPENDNVLRVGDYATVNTDALNLHSAASLTGSVIAVLEGGEEVTILSGPVAADGYNWFRVRATAGTGWVAGEFLFV